MTYSSYFTNTWFQNLFYCIYMYLPFTFPSKSVTCSIKHGGLLEIPECKKLQFIKTCFMTLNYWIQLISSGGGDDIRFLCYSCQRLKSIYLFDHHTAMGGFRKLCFFRHLWMYCCICQQMPVLTLRLMGSSVAVHGLDIKPLDWILHCEG